MLVVSGFIFVEDEPVDKMINNGAHYFSFTGVNKDPWSGERKHYRISVYVSPNQYEVAISSLKRGTAWLLRTANLDSWKPTPESKGYMHEVKAAWKDLQPLKTIPQ